MAKTLLLVEDMPESAELMKDMLEMEGYNVDVVGTGEEALERASNKEYDGMVLDIMLPRVDGFEVCRRIKANPKTAKILVICVTAFSVPDIKQKTKKVGAEEVILKPFEPSDLLNAVRKHIPNS
ncbi:MAG: response regulator [Candidatus Margulisiibacteriota bacterium]|nr:response regulator [Candidatus Margulisiibacteriota bacterium]